MPITAEQLIFQLSAKVSGFENEISAAANIFDKAAARIESGFGRMDKRIEQSSRANASNVKTMVTAITGALGVREVAQYADAWTKAKNALVSAKVPTQAQASTMERLFKQSQDYSVQLNSQVSLYGQVSRAAAGLTDNTDDVFRFTEAVAAGLKADGRSASEASGALLQLGQALRSPIIQAEEFNSLIDGAPSLLEAAANGIARFNGDLGALIATAKGGDLASREFFEGVIKGSNELKARVGQSADTFEGAFVRIENALTRYIGRTDEGLSASQRLIAGLNAFADDFDNVADTALKLAAVISGALVGRAIGGMITTIPIAIVSVRLLMLASSGAASAASFMAANFGGATRAIAATTAASRAFKIAAVGLLAGPIGAILGGVVTTFIAFSDQIFTAGENTEAAAAKADRYAAALRRIEGAADKAGDAVEDSGKKFLQSEVSRLKEALKTDEEAYRAAAEAVSKEVDAYLKSLQEVEDIYGDDPKFKAQVAGLKAIREGLDGTAAGADRAKEALGKLVNENEGEFGSLSSALKPLIQDLKVYASLIAESTAGLNDMANARQKLTGFRSESREEAQRARQADAFLNEQKALELRTSREKEIASLAEKYMKEATEAAKASKNAGLAITKAEAEAKARETVSARGGQEGFEGAVSGYVGRVVGAESGGDTAAKNPNSSATGLGQFIKSTWLALFKKHFPGEASGMTDAAILAMRTDAAKSRTLIEAYARENAAILQQAGISVNDAADEYKLQLAHFLGPQGAINVLKAAPGTLASAVLPASAVKANPTILGGGRTVDDVIAYGQKRAGQTSSGTERIDARDNFAKRLEEQRAYIETLKEETGLRAGLNPLVDDYGQKLSTLQAAQQLFADAQREGTDAGKELQSVQQLLKGDLSGLSPIAREQALAMRALAEETGTAEAAGNRLIESQADLKDRMAESSAFGKDVLGGFIRDLRAGQDETDALANALDKLADKLLDMALDGLFNTSGGGGGFLGNVFGSLFGGGFKANTTLGNFLTKGYSSGTANTGGSRGKPAGVVHGQEAVIPLPSGGKVPVQLSAPNLVPLPLQAPDLSGYGRSSPDIRYVEVPYVAEMVASDNGEMISRFRRISQEEIGSATPQIVGKSVAAVGKRARTTKSYLGG
jgi:tape measure domain-containing protein